METNYQDYKQYYDLIKDISFHIVDSWNDSIVQIWNSSNCIYDITTNFNNIINNFFKCDDDLYNIFKRFGNIIGNDIPRTYEKYKRKHLPPLTKIIKRIIRKEVNFVFAGDGKNIQDILNNKKLTLTNKKEQIKETIKRVIHEFFLRPLKSRLSFYFSEVILNDIEK